MRADAVCGMRRLLLLLLLLVAWMHRARVGIVVNRSITPLRLSTRLRPRQVRWDRRTGGWHRSAPARRSIFHGAAAAAAGGASDRRLDLSHRLASQRGRRGRYMPARAGGGSGEDVTPPPRTSTPRTHHCRHLPLVRVMI